MAVFTINCDGLNSESEFWDLYLAETNPEGACYFGHNLDAFWDALSGGPGWPGECELRFVNTRSLQNFNHGKFYVALKEIARDSKVVPVYFE